MPIPRRLFSVPRYCLVHLLSLLYSLSLLSLFISITLVVASDARATSDAAQTQQIDSEWRGVQPQLYCHVVLLRLLVQLLCVVMAPQWISSGVVYVLLGIGVLTTIVNLLSLLRLKSALGHRCAPTVIARAIYWACARGAHVINLSIGVGVGQRESLEEAVSYAVERGVVVVCSVGNDAFYGHTHPADHPHTITVGAVDDLRRVSHFSSRSSVMDVSAPGVDVFSCSNQSRDRLVPMSGTSMSSPFVAGLAACVVQRRRDIGETASPSDVRELIIQCTTDEGPTGFDEFYGWGVVSPLRLRTLLSTAYTPILRHSFSHLEHKLHQSSANADLSQPLMVLFAAFQHYALGFLFGTELLAGLWYAAAVLALYLEGCFGELRPRLILLGGVGLASTLYWQLLLTAPELAIPVHSAASLFGVCLVGTLVTHVFLLLWSAGVRRNWVKLGAPLFRTPRAAVVGAASRTPLPGALRSGAASVPIAATPPVNYHCADGECRIVPPSTPIKSEAAYLAASEQADRHESQRDMMLLALLPICALCVLLLLAICSWSGLDEVRQPGSKAVVLLSASALAMCFVAIAARLRQSKYINMLVRIMVVTEMARAGMAPVTLSSNIASTPSPYSPFGLYQLVAAVLALISSVSLVAACSSLQLVDWSVSLPAGLSSFAFQMAVFKYSLM
jgi:Subtilase family